MFVETNISSELLALWSESLDDRVIHGRLIGATQKSKVYRLVGQNQNYIAKVTPDKESVHRAVLVNQFLDRNGFMRNQRSLMMQSGVFGGEYHIVFSDDRLLESRKGGYFATKVMRILSQLHVLDARNLPPVCCSHTPSFNEIVQVVWTLDRSMLGQSMRSMKIGPRARKKVIMLHDILQSVKLNGLQTSEAICHGDAHAGNFLWSYKVQNLCLIDWEYLHIDNPYFDLFQFIDATSPNETLKCRVSRKNVLLAYTKMSAVRGIRDCSQRNWFHGYFFYAAFHLFWIVQRIWCDLEQNRFEMGQLKRQLVETYSRLIGIERDLGNL